MCIYKKKRGTHPIACVFFCLKRNRNQKEKTATIAAAVATNEHFTYEFPTHSEFKDTHTHS